MNIGNKIKKLLKLRGITQEQLAESIGISFQAVSKWENNIALPDITLAPFLASFFGVSMD
ncbi:MAG: helix-turn-helix transcriptional regulator [Clostridia bacterium]|nr:helix-turn-helix transcriptional regulator [Clostridia bacterium]